MQKEKSCLKEGLIRSERCAALKVECTCNAKCRRREDAQMVGQLINVSSEDDATVGERSSVLVSQPLPRAYTLYLHGHFGIQLSTWTRMSLESRCQCQARHQTRRHLHVKSWHNR